MPKGRMRQLHLIGQIVAWALWLGVCGLAVAGFSVALDGDGSPRAVAGLAVWVGLTPIAAALMPVRVTNLGRRRLIAAVGLAALLVAGASPVRIRDDAVLLAGYFLGLAVGGTALWWTVARSSQSALRLQVGLFLRGLASTARELDILARWVPSQSLGLDPRGGPEEVRRAIEEQRIELGLAFQRAGNAYDVEDLAKEVLLDLPFLEMVPPQLRGNALAAIGAQASPPVQHHEYRERRRATDRDWDVLDWVSPDERKWVIERVAKPWLEAAAGGADAADVRARTRADVPDQASAAGDPQREELIARMRNLQTLEVELSRRELEHKTLLVVLVPVAMVLLDTARAFHVGGPALALLGFVAFWVGAVMLVWTQDAQAWSGLGRAPVRFGDFVYIAVGSAFASAPGGLEAKAPVARMLLTAEALSGATLIGAFIADLWRGRAQSVAPGR